MFALAGLNSVWAQAPAAAAAPAFDVASVKQTLHRSGGSGLPYSGFLGTGGNPIKIVGNRVTLEGTLNVLIMAAYNVKDYLVNGGPPWTDSDVFSIVAKTDGEDTPKLDQVRPMLQALLADRFQLKLTRDDQCRGSVDAEHSAEKATNHHRRETRLKSRRFDPQLWRNFSYDKASKTPRFANFLYIISRTLMCQRIAQIETSWKRLQERVTFLSNH